MTTPGLFASVVVPAYNEAARIGESLRHIGRYLEQRTEPCELIVVDDGSSDHTARIVAQFADAAPFPARLIRSPTNRGKGHAVRTGFLAARGEILLFTDADLSAPIDEADKLLSPLRDDSCDVAVGSRAVDRSMVTRHQSILRETLGRSFNLAVRAVTGLPLLDTQCGFKAFRRAQVIPLAAAMQVDRFGFDIELLGLCAAAGLRIAEIPVAWRHADGSKVSVGRDGLVMLLEMGRFELRLGRGHYASAIAESRRAGPPGPWMA